MTVLLIGCGRMGGALARNWAKSQDVLVFDPNADLPEGVRRVDSLDPATLPPDLVVVVAVKPQILDSALPPLVALAKRGDLFLSVVVGVTLAGLSERLGGTQRIVRSMPNTPAAIGKGITAAVAGPAVTDADRARTDALLQAAGDVVWLDAEDDINAVTGISGSGPAYFFRFTEALTKAGIAAGLTPEMSARLARATFTGSAALADVRPEPLADLRIEVTSPGGATAAGLVQMDTDDAIDTLVEKVVRAVAARSQELAG